MQRARNSTRNASRRRGLAPLELVLSLPLLLLMTALMVNFGDAGLWKIRTHTAARYSATRSLAFRSGEFNPPPDNWQPPATLSHAGGPNVDPVDPFWNSGPEITTSAIRGRQITDPWAGQMIRVERELEMHAGAHVGNATTTRRYHQAPRAMPVGSRYTFDLNQDLLDHDWDFADLGYRSNLDRRARLWYAIEPADLGLQSLQNQLDQALRQLQTSPLWSLDLSPLDDDDEFKIYRSGIALDFIPRPSGCELEAEIYRTSGQFDRFLEQIRRRPGVMARAFIAMYRAEIARQRGNPPLIPPQPPPPGGESWQILEEKVRQLQQFLANLPPQYQ